MQLSSRRVEQGGVTAELRQSKQYVRVCHVFLLDYYCHVNDSRASSFQSSVVFTCYVKRATATEEEKDGD